MNKRYTILHISDLHKSPNTSYDNLFESLCVDCEHYMADGIEKPEIIVVSGDLVEGSRNTEVKKAEEEIWLQYEEVTKFLDKLVAYFLDGDKRRIIIVPGNHDVFRCISSESMIKEAVNDEDEIWKKRQQISNGNSRWNWKDLSFYTINDKKKYDSRFDLFKKFYDNFFNGLNPARTWQYPCDQHSQILDLPEYNICFLGLNSCYRLDHLNESGSIYPAALTKVQRHLCRIAKRGSLIVGVWHHHTTGLPHENNYLDYRILQSLIDAQVKVGLYGHQHLTSILNEYHDLTRKERILLISSGSLYGNRNQLVTGCPRQYGLLSLDFHDNEVSLTLRVRKDPTNYDIPSWRTSQIGTSSLTEYHENIQLSELKPELFIQEINDYVQSTNDYENGYINMMKFIDLNKETCLKFADSYLNKIHNEEFIRKYIFNPETDTQFVCLLRTAVEKKDQNEIRRLIAYEKYQSIKNPFMIYLKEEIDKIL